MENITIIGNVTKEPQRLTSKSGNEFVVASVAVNKGPKDARVVDYFDCTFYGKGADTIMQYVHKGSKLAVSGELNVRTYTGNDGSKKFNLGITNCAFEFVGSSRPENAQPASSPDDGWSDLKPDDIPF